MTNADDTWTDDAMARIKGALRSGTLDRDTLIAALVVERTESAGYDVTPGDWAKARAVLALATGLARAR